MTTSAAGTVRAQPPFSCEIFVFFFESNLLCSGAMPYVTHNHTKEKKEGALA